MLLTNKQFPYYAVFMLPNSLEIVCEVIERNMSTITVRNPLTLMNSRDGGLQYSPITFLGDPEKPIVLHNVLFETEPSVELVTSYKTQVSGILMPQQGVIK